MIARELRGARGEQAGNTPERCSVSAHAAAAASPRDSGAATPGGPTELRVVRAQRTDVAARLTPARLPSAGTPAASTSVDLSTVEVDKSTLVTRRVGVPRRRPCRGSSHRSLRTPGPAAAHDVTERSAASPPGRAGRLRAAVVDAPGAWLSAFESLVRGRSRLTPLPSPPRQHRRAVGRRKSMQPQASLARTPDNHDKRWDGPGEIRTLV